MLFTIKRLLTIIIAFGFIPILCLAQENYEIKKVGLFSKKSHDYVLTGYVDEIHIENPLKGQKSKVIIYSKDGKGIVFFVKKTTTFYNRDLNSIRLEMIPVKSLVRIRYRSDSDGFYEALSITSLDK